MNLGKSILLVGLFFTTFGCNQNKSPKEKVEPTNIASAFDSNVIDTIDYQSVLSFTGEVQLSKFGEPGVEYKVGDTLPNQALILRLNSPKSFYYKNDLDSLSYSFYKEYDQFQILAKDSAIAVQLNDLIGKEVTLEGTIFQGLTKHYIRDLAININKLNNNN